MNSIEIRWGSSKNLIITRDDPSSVSATFIVGLVDSPPVIEKTALFVDNVADVSLDSADTMVTVGTYKYQVNVLLDDGNIKKFPEATSCDDGELPDFIVYESLDNEVS